MNDIPTFAELLSSILTDLRNKLGLKFIIGKVWLNAFALTQAAKLKILYTSLSFVYDNIFIDTSSPESLGGSTERLGFFYLGRPPFPATAGEYNVSVTGNIGAVIPENTTYKSLNDKSTSPNKLFILDNEFTFTQETGTILIRALDLGTEARLEINDELQATAPLLNTSDFAIVTSVEERAVNAESIPEYKLKAEAAAREEPQGGAKVDYQLWSTDAAGVRRSYPYVKDGDTGLIDLYVEANPESSVSGFGIPPQSMLDEVEIVVEKDPDTTKPNEDRGRRPATARRNILPIILNNVDVQIFDLSDPTLLSSLESAIIAFLFTIRPFIDGADDINDSNSDKLYSSAIINVIIGITQAAGASFGEVKMFVNDDELTVYQFDLGNIPKLRNLTNP
jgi:hypothetical protein